MSRIGKSPIPLPAGVTVNIDGNVSVVKGPKGEHRQHIPEGLHFEEKDGILVITPPDESKKMRARHGLVRALVANQVLGVTEGFMKKLEIQGVGYRAQIQGNKVVFSLGHSHPIEFQLPEGISVEGDKKQVQLTISGIDKQLIGQVAADMRALRPPDAYKGKGVRYAGERIKLKAGKAAK